MAKKSATLHIHISNVSEDVWDFIDTLSPVKKNFEIRENAELSDRDLFCFTHTDDVILIVPKEVDPGFLEYFFELFPKNNCQVVWPETHTGELCLDTIVDSELSSVLKKNMKAYEKISVTSYSTTQQFYKLLTHLRTMHSHIVTPESPTENWTVEYFGTKAGFRQCRFSHTGKVQFPMCDGMITMGTRTAAAIAKTMYKKFPGVVLKTNKGHAGMGVMIVRKGDLDQEQDLTDQIQKLIPEDYWKQFPIVVEEYVVSDASVGGGFPNAECFVDEKGRVHYLYSCGMRVNTKGEFKGVEIGKGAMNKRAENKLIQYGNSLGKIFASNGYIGYFDVDCLAGKDGEIYVSESNVRKTGGTHVYLTALNMFGKNFTDQTYALSNNLYQIEDKKRRTFTQLKIQLTPVLFDHKTKEGLLIVAANLLHRSVFGYIIFGKTKKRAYQIEEKMEQLLAGKLS